MHSLLFACLAATTCGRAGADAPRADAAPRGGQVIDLVGRAGRCPTVEQVAAVLKAGAPEHRVELQAAPPEAVPVALLDEGPVLRVLVGGRERTFRDPGRHCAERSRSAAVFVLMVIAPPAHGEEPALADADLEALLRAQPASGAIQTSETGDSTSVPATAGASLVAVGPQPTVRAAVPGSGIGHTSAEAGVGADINPPLHRAAADLDLDVAALLEPAVAPLPRVAAGAHLGVSAVRRWVGGTVRLGVLSAVGLEAGGVVVPLTPLRADLGLRLRWRGQVELVGDLGPSLVADVLGPVRGSTAVRLEPQAWVGLGVRVPLSSMLLLSAGVEARLSLRPIEVQDPSGLAFTETPRFWLGALVGLGYRILQGPR